MCGQQKPLTILRYNYKKWTDVSYRKPKLKKHPKPSHEDVNILTEEEIMETKPCTACHRTSGLRLLACSRLWVVTKFYTRNKKTIVNWSSLTIFTISVYLRFLMLPDRLEVTDPFLSAELPNPVVELVLCMTSTGLLAWAWWDVDWGSCGGLVPEPGNALGDSLSDATDELEESNRLDPVSPGNLPPCEPDSWGKSLGL